MRNRRGLIPGGWDGECQVRATPIPNAVVVTSCDVKYVVARRQVVVKRLAPASRFSPVPIMAFQAIAEPHSFRDYKAEGRIIDFDLPGTVRAPSGSRRI